MKLEDVRFQVKVTPEESEKIQLAGFEKGMEWVSGSKKVMHTTAQYLAFQFVYGCPRLTFGKSKYGHKYCAPLVTVEEALSIIESIDETSKLSPAKKAIEKVERTVIQRYKGVDYVKGKINGEPVNEVRDRMNELRRQIRTYDRMNNAGELD